MNAGLESLFRLSGLVEVEQRLEIPVGDRPAIRAARQSREDGPGASFIRTASARTAREHRAAAGCVVGGLGGIGSGDRDDVHRGVAEVQLVGRAREAALRRLKDAFSLPMAPDERHADFVRTSLHRQTHRESLIGGVHVDFPFRIALCVAGKALRRRQSFPAAADREPLDQRAVQADVDLVRLAHADQVQIELAPEQHLDAVLAIQRELIGDRDATARPEGKIVARPIVLHQRGGNLERVFYRADRTIPNRQSTDDTRCGEIVLEQPRRDRKHSGDVVEALLVRFVSGQQRSPVDIQREKIANRVRVLRAVQPMDDDPTRIGIRCGGRVECGFE